MREEYPELPSQLPTLHLRKLHGLKPRPSATTSISPVRHAALRGAQANTPLNTQELPGPLDIPVHSSEPHVSMRSQAWELKHTTTRPPPPRTHP